MGTKKLSRPFVTILALVITSLACQQAGFAAATATQAPPTATATATVKPTATKKPTATPRPTATPNAAATKQVTDFESLLADFVSKGYAVAAEGKISKLDDFKEEWAQMHYYNFFPPMQEIDSDFLFKSHIKWSTASSTPELSGCGIAFGLQEQNGDHYMVVFDTSRIYFGMNRGNRTWQVGKTRGSGRLNFENPAEADVIISVKGGSTFISVDGDVTEYTLSVDQTTYGTFAFSLLSGTNRDYGTRCEMTDNMLWVADR